MAVTAGLTGVGAVLSIVPYVALTEIAAAWSRHAPSSVVWGWLAAGVAGLFLGHALYSAGLGLTHVAEARLRHRLRRDIVATLARIPLGTVDQTSSGAIRKIVCDDTTSIHTLVAHLTGDATNSAVTIAAGVAYLLWVDWRLTLVIVALWVLLVGVVAGVAVSGFGDITERFGAAQTRLAAATVEMVEGIKEIKNFQASESARTRFTEAREGFSGLSYEWTMASGRAFAIAGAFLQPAVVFATVAPMAALFVAQDWIEPAYALPFFFLSLGIPAGLMTLMQLGRHLYEARQAARTTAELLSIPAMPEGEDVEGDGPAPGAVELSGVTFGYDPEEPVVRDVSLSIPPGSVTALVGPSGGGKTTLARLIARFYDVDSGRVEVGGLDVRDVSFAWLLSRVAVVFQDVTLAHGTVAENIALGHPEAAREEIERAATAACIHDRILRLPRGYDTVIGEEGGFLSGGERQRLTIARAYLQDAPILILDEATAQADPQSEREIHRALTRLADGRTVVIIAHRLATIVGADQIAVVDRGRIAERGRHEELLAAGGLYARLWRSQQSKGRAGAERDPQTGAGREPGADGSRKPGGRRGTERAGHCGEREGHGGAERANHRGTEEN